MNGRDKHSTNKIIFLPHPLNTYHIGYIVLELCFCNFFPHLYSGWIWLSCPHITSSSHFLSNPHRHILNLCVPEIHLTVFLRPTLWWLYKPLLKKICQSSYLFRHCKFIFNYYSLLVWIRLEITVTIGHTDLIQWWMRKCTYKSCAKIALGEWGKGWSYSYKLKIHIYI